MQAIVQSVLSRYFQLFIKDFTTDQFELSLFRGEGSLHNIGALRTRGRACVIAGSSLLRSEFHPETIQEILYIPTNLVVTKATCNHLRLQVRRRRRCAFWNIPNVQMAMADAAAGPDSALLPDQSARDVPRHGRAAPRGAGRRAARAHQSRPDVGH